MTNERERGLREMGVALEKDNSKDFFYSDSLGKFVAYDFLKIDVRVVDAASKLGIHLDWDEEGHVCNINFTEARRLLDGLGSHLLTPKEYWQVRNEADKNGEVRAVRSLELDIGTEWLDAVFIKKAPTGPVLLIEHPLVLANGINQESSTILTQPDARPGWFNPVNNINADTGMPISISLTREKGTPAWSQTTWKYWSTFQTNKLVAGIRGYVTSSGTPSLDLDIPVEARQPVLFIRECRDELQNPEIRPELIEEFIRLEEVYLPTLALFPGVKNSGKHQIFYEQNQKLLEFVNTSYKEVATSNEKSALHIKEHVHDMLGIVYLEALKRGDRVVVKDIKTLQEATFGLSPEAGKYSHLKEFLESRRNELTKAVSENKRIVFVMGHKNPDTDTAISALFESYLKSLTDRDTVYVPVIQANRLPDEIAHLLGEDLSRAYVCTSEKIYQNAENLGQIRWILVDHNKSEKQRFTISMVDHHILSDVAKNQEIPKTWEMVGSCSAQITLKLYGLGVTLDGQTARLLHGATLMDTENRGPKKMTSRDILIMDNLRSASGVRDENSFYQELMGYLLNTDDSERLFQRDYKEDWGVFGFAVAKVKNVFDEKGGTLKPKVLAGLIKEAELNNSAKHFCMTLVKVVDYKQDNQTVNREKIYLVFNDFAPVEFRQVMLEGIERIVRFEFGEKINIAKEDNTIEFWGTGDQLSRKVTAPKFEVLVAAFNEFYFSPSTNLFIKREFLKQSPEIENAAAGLGIKLYTDSQGRICNITYNEAKKLVQQLGYQMLSLPEYWEVLRETHKIHDIQMNGHLKSRGFVEFLDTVVLNYQETINHPKIVDGEPVKYRGKGLKSQIPPAFPALIYPQEINPKSGFPTSLHLSQEKYGDPKTWRYWSPDTSLAIPTRGYIFLLDKPALDCKIHPDDALPNLGIRVVAREVKYPKVRFEENGEDLEIKVDRSTLI